MTVHDVRGGGGGVRCAGDRVRLDRGYGWPMVYQFNQPPMYYWDTDIQARTLTVQDGIQWRERAFTANANRTVHIHMDDPDFASTIQERTDEWRTTTDSGHSIEYDGDLSPGQAIAFLGKIPGPSGTPHYELIVIEAFNTTAHEIDSVGMTYGADWWLQNGPAKLRRMGDAAWVWESHAKSSIGFGLLLGQLLLRQAPLLAVAVGWQR